MPGLRDTGIALVVGARRGLGRRRVYVCSVVVGCLMAVAWLAPAALASDSIYWSSYRAGGGIRIGGLDGTGARDLVTPESSPEGIAIDPAAGKIYWADTTSGAIRVANLDGSGVQNLYTGESQASGVAIDPAAGKIYWSDAVTRTGAIRVGNLDGSGTRPGSVQQRVLSGGRHDRPGDGQDLLGQLRHVQGPRRQPRRNRRTRPVHRRELSHRHRRR